MNKLLLPLNYTFLLSLFFSCSVVQKAAVNTTAELANNGQKELQTMNSWETIKAAIPAQIVFAETLIASHPSNTTLLAQLIKGNAALGFVVYETQALQFEGSDQKSSDEKKYYTLQAQLAYSRALNWGEKFLLHKNIKWNDLLIGVNDEQKLYHLLDKKLSHEDNMAIFFIGQAWASLINLSRDQVRLVNHLPIARNLIQYVCKKDPNFENGMCTLFEAIYQLSRPKMLGGNPDLGNAMFKEVIKKYPTNLLYPVSYIQFYLLPQKKFKEINDYSALLETEFQHYWDAQKLPSYLVSKNIYTKEPQHNLYNTIAYIRLRSINRNMNTYK